MDMKIRRELRQALEAFEAQELEEIILAQREDDFTSLRQIIATDSATKEGYRQKALYALGEWGNPVVVPDIVEILPELDETVRITAINALGKLGTGEAFETVARYSDDPSPQVRKFVVKALGQIELPQAGEQLQALASDDPEQWIRELAVKQIEKKSTSGKR